MPTIVLAASFRQPWGICALALVVSLVAASPADARITHLVVDSVQPVFDGMTFGNVGAYEKLRGRLFGEVDPADERNTLITDIRLAPRNAAGKVEYSTDFMVLRPVDRSKGNRRLFLELPNRGLILALPQINDAPVTANPSSAAHAGNGFLMRQGYTYAAVGWDISAGAAPTFLKIRVPIAKQSEGSNVVGPSIEEFIFDNGTTMAANLHYPAATMAKRRAQLTVRTRTDDPATPLDASGWEFVDERSIRLLPRGTPFANGAIYEFVYLAKEPLIAGLGLAAVRDATAFLRSATADDRGTPNPLAGSIDATVSFCVSQPCRTMRDFVQLGFNRDESGRRVFDGVLNYIGGASGVFLNYRFAQPDRTHRQRLARHVPEFRFPFAEQVLTDSVTGKRDGVLRRCVATRTCPKIFEVNSSNEYWAKNMALLHTDTRGHDISNPDNVRFYLLASLPHGASPPDKGICVYPRNPLTGNAVLRAMIGNLDSWATEGREPPPSQVPLHRDGTLVSLATNIETFPRIPGVRHIGRMHKGDLFDFGPGFDNGILSVLPPIKKGSPYPERVPAVDRDGNEVAGIRIPDIAVPRATFTGWNLVDNASGDGCDHFGMRVEFARTREERQRTGDPRLSIEERYPSPDAYVKSVERAVETLRKDRFLLDEDAERYVKAASSAALK